MDWKEINKPPKETFGWFAVATLPRNHSGSGEKDNTDLAGDNSWREYFGFTKAWLNNGEWFEPELTSHRSSNITRFVTHWDYLPKAPVLSKSHKTYNKNNIFERPTREEIQKVAMKEWESDQKTNPNVVNPHAYSYGFLAAFRFLGLR